METWKNVKNGKMLNQFIKTRSLKYLHLLGMKRLICLIDHIIYLLYKIILSM